MEKVDDKDKNMLDLIFVSFKYLNLLKIYKTQFKLNPLPILNKINYLHLNNQNNVIIVNELYLYHIKR